MGDRQELDHCLLQPSKLHLSISQHQLCVMYQTLCKPGYWCGTGPLSAWLYQPKCWLMERLQTFLSQLGLLHRQQPRPYGGSRLGSKTNTSTGNKGSGKHSFCFASAILGRARLSSPVKCAFVKLACQASQVIGDLQHPYCPTSQTCGCSSPVASCLLSAGHGHAARVSTPS